jgi:hypothetical protein
MGTGTGTEMGQSKPAWCPGCKYFGYDCNPEPEDYDEPCDAYEETEKGAWIWL